MSKVAIITITDSKILPVKVEFPTNVGNYKNVDCVLQDCKLFKCIPIFV